MLTAGSNYYPGGNNALHVRISYAAAPSPTDIDAAVRRLGPLLAGGE